MVEPFLERLNKSIVKLRCKDKNTCIEYEIQTVQFSQLNPTQLVIQVYNLTDSRYTFFRFDKDLSKLEVIE